MDTLCLEGESIRDLPKELQDQIMHYYAIKRLKDYHWRPIVYDSNRYSYNFTDNGSGWFTYTERIPFLFNNEIIVKTYRYYDSNHNLKTIMQNCWVEQYNPNQSRFEG